LFVSELPSDIVRSLAGLGLLAPGEHPAAEPLPGGVSSDIWRVELKSGPACVKRALAKLKVAADWRAPVERNAFEAAWIETANRLAPSSAPRIFGHDAKAGLFAMEYLSPATHRLWKEELRQGRADPAFAGTVGATLARIHAGTANDAGIAARFATDAIFRAIRLEPYLEAAARAHPDRADRLRALVERTAATRLALVHGDVSPKNILIGPRGPVFLDAECAWYGDPAFDLAFCLNHFLLKCLWTPGARAGFLESFRALARAYLAGVAWEAPAAIERRAAELLPGLFLARVDGKSPVEYLTDAADKDKVRRVARALLAEPPARLDPVATAWNREIAA
jgi:aminoglycoside phosphotransferase (APT) family kinase protein